MNKVLVLGGNGMVRNMIKTYFKKNGYDVYYTQTKNFRDNKVYLHDIMKNMKKLEKIMKTNKI